MTPRSRTRSADPLDDFATSTFEAHGRTRDVYRLGSGPAVVVLAELPGITPQVADFARTVAAAGLTAVLPRLFGEPGRPMTAATLARTVVPACVSREFRAFATRSETPVSRWLRSLATALHRELGGPGVGAVGMCFTGGFALGMMADEALLAPVLSQPSLPLGPGRRSRSSLGVSPEQLAAASRRAAEGTQVMGLRFTCDPLVPDERFERLRQELGDSFIGVEIDSSPGNPWGLSRWSHSVLTDPGVGTPGHPAHEALERVIAFLVEKLSVGDPRVGPDDR